MNKYVETAEDVNVEGVEFYVPTESDGFVYSDSECTKKVPSAVLDHAFRMNDIVIIDNQEACRPFSLGNSDGDVVISYAKVVENDNVLSLVAKQVKSFDLSLTTDANVSDSVDLFGKVASDLQSEVVVSDGKITGTLKYVTGYTGFDGSHPELQEGNYLVIHNETNGSDPIFVELVGGISGPVQLDLDGIIVLRIANVDQIVKVTTGDLVKEYSLKELTLLPAEN